MAKNPVTASERRGILVVAALALGITAAGVLLPHCHGKEDSTLPVEITTIQPSDSTVYQSEKSTKESSRKGKKKKKSKKIVTYRERTPLEEPV